MILKTVIVVSTETKKLEIIRVLLKKTSFEKLLKTIFNKIIRMLTPGAKSIPSVGTS